MSLFKKITTLLSTLVFATVLIYTPFQVAKVNTEYAFAGGATGGATEPTQILNNIELAYSSVKNAITAAATQLTAFNTGSLWFKENILDPLSWSIAKALLAQFTQSIVNWINSGFQGSPAFVTDLKGFLLDVADIAAGEYINDFLGLGFLCQPFELDIKIALSIQYNTRTRDHQPPECTLSDIVSNIDGFLNGNFADGGWGGFLELTQRPQNTPYGSFLYASIELDGFVAEKRNEEQKLLDFGNGFFSSKICTAVTGQNAKDCTISNPGKVIVTQLNDALGLGNESLIVADELSEIINALFNQLAKQAITGAGGLLGLSGGTGFTNYSYGGNGVVATVPYTQALSTETQGGGAGNAQIKEYESRLTSWIQYHQFVVSTVNNLEAQNNANAAAFPTCYTVQVPSSIISRKTSSQNQITVAQTVTQPALVDLQTRLDSASADAEASLADSDPTNDTTLADLQLAIFNELKALEDGGLVPSSMDIALLEVNDRQTFQKTIGNFQTTMSNQVNLCQNQQNNNNSGN